MAALPHGGEQLTNANSTGRLKSQGRWEGDSGGCRGKGVTAARPYSLPARSPSIRPAASAVLKGKIGALQMEIAKLETKVAGQRADLEILRYAEEPRLESLLRQLIAEADERLEQLQQEKAKNRA
jgi:hypothetical protein